MNEAQFRLHMEALEAQQYTLDQILNNVRWIHESQLAIATEHRERSASTASQPTASPPPSP